MLKWWEDLFNNFKIYYPVVAEHTVDCYCSGPSELTITTDEGRKIIYNDVNTTIRYLKSREEPIINEKEWRTIFSENLYRMLKKKCISCKQLSEYTGLSQSSISNMLKGKCTPSSYNIQLIANTLECSVNELFDF